MHDLVILKSESPKCITVRGNVERGVLQLSSINGTVWSTTIFMRDERRHGYGEF